MNFIEYETAEKLRGGYYTDKRIAAFLVRWVNVIEPENILEPSCGDGVFISEIEKQAHDHIRKITACEINTIEAEKTKNISSLPVKVINDDFLRWYLWEGRYNDRYDAVVGNPPFIRYQYLPDEQQSLAEKIFGLLKLPFTKHTNAWVTFVLTSIILLKPGGRLAMVVPSEIFHIPHARSLRQYLAEQCSKILIVDSEEIWFSGTLQGTVLLLAEKKKENDTQLGKGVAVIRASSNQILLDDPEVYFRNAEYKNGTVLEGKWMSVFLSKNERALINEIKERKNVKLFSEIAEVDVGIVTGANAYFLVTDETIRKYDLGNWSYPMFGRSSYVKGLIYTKEDHDENRLSGLPVNFLSFPENGKDSLPYKVNEYLEIGERQKISLRYKCRTRKTWYSVPSVYLTKIGMLKRANNYHRLILNEAGAYTTDTAYRIKPKQISAESLVMCFVNSLTCLSAELEGRHYGGGVLELVPSEIERLPIPVIDISIGEAESLDGMFRKLRDSEEFLRLQDSRIFNEIGVSKKEQEILFSAWVRLRNRRQRRAESNKMMDSLESDTQLEMFTKNGSLSISVS